jgi:hypothetical protein
MGKKSKNLPILLQYGKKVVFFTHEVKIREPRASSIL